MRKQLIFSLYLMLTINFVGYSQSNVTGKLTKWAKIYQITLDSYFEQDGSVFDTNVDFIAINFAILPFVSDYDKKTIAMWFESQYAPVLDTNLAGLKDRGLVDIRSSYIPDGVLLSIYEVTETDNEIVIRGSIWRGPETANGYITIWQLKNGIWEFSRAIWEWQA